MLGNEELANAIEVDFNTAPELSSRRRVMLTYALKLTRTPTEMTQADVGSLRTAGFSELDILHIVEVTAYYAYVNRLADALGVSLEPT